jgi:hypothetical protein
MRASTDSTICKRRYEEALEHAPDESIPSGAEVGGHVLSGISTAKGTYMKTLFHSASTTTLTCISFSMLLAVPLAAQSADQLEGKNVSIKQTNFKGRGAIQVIANPDAQNATSYAVIKGTSFRDGTIEVDLAGQPNAAAAAFGARGFIGIAFRLQGDGRYV